MNKDIQNNNYFSSIEQLIEYLEKCSNKLIIRISIENKTNQSIKKIEDGIEISSSFIELWKYIKKFIPATILSLEIPFSLIEQDIEFLNNFSQLKAIIINDDFNLNLENIKQIKEETQIKEIRVNNIPTNITDCSKQEGVTYLGYPYNYIDYYGLKIYPNTQKDIQTELEFEDMCSINIEFSDLKSNAIKELYDMVHPNFKKIVTLSNNDYKFEITHDSDKEIREILFYGTPIEDTLNIFNYFKENGYTIKNIIYQFENEKYYDFDISKFKDLSAQCNFAFRYNKKTSYNDTSYNDFENLQMCIKWYRKLVLDYNLSPCEKLMLAYDIMKSFEYSEENEIMDDKLSRDPSNIMKTGYIVCVGYSILMEEILRDLDPNLTITSFSVTEHERNLVKIDDEKYDIHGIFSIDSTWDNAKNAKEDGYNSLDLYSYFLIPNNQYDNVFGDELPEIFKYVNKEKYKKHKLNRELDKLFGSANVNEETMLKYVNTTKPSLNSFVEMIINVRMSEGYTKEQALIEVQNIVKVNQEIASNYSQDGIEFNFFEESKHIR